MKIKISKKSYAILEDLAQERNEKPEKVLKTLIKKNKNGIPFDVDAYGIEENMSVALDSLIKLNKIYKISKNSIFDYRVKTLTFRKLEDFFKEALTYCDIKVKN